MDINKLVSDFENVKLDTLMKDIKEEISSKTREGCIFPPYIPLIGKEYNNFRILIYATAQNMSHEGCVANAYSDLYKKNPTNLVKRLYRSHKDADFKCSDNELKFSEVDIQPWRTGILPALVGLFLKAVRNQQFQEFGEIQDRVAVTNYYKFSLHIHKGNKDLNPNSLNKDKRFEDYLSLNDKLVKMELECLRPQYVLTFGWRQFNFLKGQQLGFKVERINDPAWILRGGSGCLKPGKRGSWYHKVKDILYDNRMVDSYLDNLEDSYKRRKNEVRVYLLKYYKDWCKEVT